MGFCPFRESIGTSLTAPVTQLTVSRSRTRSCPSYTTYGQSTQKYTGHTKNTPQYSPDPWQRRWFLQRTHTVTGLCRHEMFHSYPWLGWRSQLHANTTSQCRFSREPIVAADWSITRDADRSHCEPPSNASSLAWSSTIPVVQCGTSVQGDARPPCAAPSPPQQKERQGKIGKERKKKKEKAAIGLPSLCIDPP